MKRYLLIAFVALGGAVTVHASGSKLLKPSTETKTSDDTKGAQMGAYKGVKHAVGVLDFENSGGLYSEWTLGENLRLMLESSLFATNRFIIVERGELGAVMAEQDLQASKRAAEASGVAGSGNIRSARYLVSGAVTEASTDTSGDGGGIRIRGFRIGGSSAKAAIVAVVKLIDTTTGEVVASERVRGEAGKSALNIGYSDWKFGGNLGAFAKTPLGEAAQDCIDQAVKFIASTMENFAVEGAVVTVAGEQIIINLGENRGLSEGMNFIVRRDGEVLTDPVTGEVLDRIEGKVTGTLQVTRVRDKIAYCKLVDGEMPDRGDTVILR